MCFEAWSYVRCLVNASDVYCNFVDCTLHTRNLLVPQPPPFREIKSAHESAFSHRYRFTQNETQNEWLTTMAHECLTLKLGTRCIPHAARLEPE